MRNSYNDDISNTNNCVYSTVIYIYLYYMLVNCQKKFFVCSQFDSCAVQRRFTETRSFQQALRGVAARSISYPENEVQRDYYFGARDRCGVCRDLVFRYHLNAPNTAFLCVYVFLC